ncbi:MAG TPA: PH domain-containing protein [Armatimonadota bacterium]|nr:PH domain-containing protein [Armatimonadota bacterium]
MTPHGDPVSRSGDASEDHPEVILEWSVCPAREHPGRTWAALAMIVVVLGLVGAAFGSPFYVVLACVFLLSALFPYLTRTYYRLDPDGVQVRTLFGRHRRPWDQFRIYRVSGDQILLCTRRTPSRLDTYRGCRLLLSGNEAEVRSALESVGVPYAGQPLEEAGSSCETTDAPGS